MEGNLKLYRIKIFFIFKEDARYNYSQLFRGIVTCNVCEIEISLLLIFPVLFMVILRSGKIILCRYQ